MEHETVHKELCGGLAEEIGQVAGGLLAEEFWVGVF